MHLSIDVADQLLRLAKSKNKTLTPMQLIKLVYLSHAWLLGLYGIPLVKEPIETWLYGPVIKVLYDAIKQYKSSPVIDLILNSTPIFKDIESDIIRQVFELYGDFTGIELSSLTHQEGSPWHVTWNKSGKNFTIPNNLIENYYRQLAKKPS